jgi:hypothetical protein
VKKNSRSSQAHLKLRIATPIMAAPANPNWANLLHAIQLVIPELPLLAAQINAVNLFPISHHHY